MFKNFKKIISEKLDYLVKESEFLYQVNVDKDEFWDLYLDSFPQGTNEIFRERRVYDCSCCRQFIKNYGTIVGIIDGKKVSIWDVEVDGYYQTVADILNEKIKSLEIDNVFYSKFKSLGTDSNKELIDNKTHTWYHFYYELPDRLVDSSSKSIENLQGATKQTMSVIDRSLSELTLESVDTVLELISDKTLYRGEEHESTITLFKKLKKEWNSSEDKNLFCWRTSMKQGRVAAIRNTAIGTLLINLSDGMDVELAVKKYESVVAPANYKRPKAIFTKTMVKNAESKISELGLTNSLGRRHAKLEDISISNVIWASGDSKKVMTNPFDELIGDVKESEKNYRYADEMSINDFVKNVLPTANSIELLVDNSHRNNLVSLIAPTDPDSPSLFKWDNTFSWAYSGDFTDSIKESVKARGGKVDGDLRFSLSWAENQRTDNSDLDAHCRLPDGGHIYFSAQHDYNSGGHLDVDIIEPNSQNNNDIVENITWANKSKMPKGDYKFLVHNYSLRGSQKGFSAEIEFEGQIHSFEYDTPLRDGEYVEVAIVNFDGSSFKLKKSLPSTKASKEVWGLKTMQFVPVTTFMYSPNHWDGNSIGNKHWLFFLEGCINPDNPRGFFNEYLKNELTEHKRVFEALGSKMKVEHSESQMSGVGFSNTMKNTVTVKINSKPINIKF